MMPRVDPGESSQRKAKPAAAGSPPAVAPPTVLKVAALNLAQLSDPHNPTLSNVEQAEKPLEMADEQQEELFVDADWIRKMLCAQVRDDAHLDGDLSTQLPNGSRLECSCKKGYPDGDAVITNSAGGKIRFKFSKGRPHGKALQEFQDGRKIQFEFKGGRREGEAIETLPNGQTTMFSYRNGKRYKIEHN